MNEGEVVGMPHKRKRLPRLGTAALQEKVIV